MFCLHLIAERRIKEAIDRGEFDDVAGRGQPLKIEDDSSVPEELRLAYKILKNAGCLPPEVEARREIARMEELLASLEDEQEIYLQMKRLNWAVTKLNLVRRRPVNFEEHERYYAKVCQRFASRRKPEGPPHP